MPLPEATANLTADELEHEARRLAKCSAEANARVNGVTKQNYAQLSTTYAVLAVAQRVRDLVESLPGAGRGY